MELPLANGSSLFGQYPWLLSESYRLFVRSYLTSDENGQSKIEHEWQQVKAMVVVKLTKKEQSQQEIVGKMFKVIWALEEVSVKRHAAEFG